MLRHTSTLGVRMHLCERRVLQRASTTVHTPYGDVRLKSPTAPAAGAQSLNMTMCAA